MRTFEVGFGRYLLRNALSLLYIKAHVMDLIRDTSVLYGIITNMIDYKV